MAMQSSSWCFIAEVEQNSTIGKGLTLHSLPIHGYEGLMDWSATESALSLGDYFLNICEHWIFIRLLLSVKL